MKITTEYEVDSVTQTIDNRYAKMRVKPKPEDKSKWRSSLPDLVLDVPVEVPCYPGYTVTVVVDWNDGYD